jgi:chorismate dehydratase
MITLRVGYIPYLNMAPFHRGFGPEPLKKDGIQYEFPICSPRILGLEAEHGHVDAGALSLVDSFRLSSVFEPLGDLGIGVKGPAQSVLVFSRVPLSELSGMCAVTDETATSIRLLQMLMEKRYKRPALHFGRIASSVMFDGDAEALLLIGNDALQAKEAGVPGFPIVTDLGTEWLAWQQSPFAFARWMVRKDLDLKIKQELLKNIESALTSTLTGDSTDDKKSIAYWNGFAYHLTPAHLKSIQLFESWTNAHV